MFSLRITAGDVGMTGMAKAFHDLITHSESEQLSHVE